MAEGDFVTIATIYEPDQAAMAEQILSDADIPCTIQGAMHARALAPLGGAGYIAIPIQVPQAQAEEALPVLKAFGVLKGTGADTDTDTDSDSDTDTDTDSDSDSDTDTDSDSDTDTDTDSDSDGATGYIGGISDRAHRWHRPWFGL